MGANKAHPIQITDSYAKLASPVNKTTNGSKMTKN